MKIPSTAQIDLLKNKSVYFRGYISATDPYELGTALSIGITNMYDVLEGERWFVGTPADETGLFGDKIFQNTNFPWAVKIRQNGVWVDDTYTPNHFDLWWDFNNGMEMVYWANFYWNVLSRIPTHYFTDLQTAVQDEVTARTTSDSAFDDRLDGLEASMGKVDGNAPTYADLLNIPPATVENKTYIVVTDESHGGQTSAYKSSGTEWVYLAEIRGDINLDNYYTKAQMDDKFLALEGLRGSFADISGIPTSADAAGALTLDFDGLQFKMVPVGTAAGSENTFTLKNTTSADRFIILEYTQIYGGDSREETQDVVTVAAGATFTVDTLVAYGGDYSQVVLNLTDATNQKGYRFEAIVPRGWISRNVIGTMHIEEVFDGTGSSNVLTPALRKVSADGETIFGDGTPENPLSASIESVVTEGTDSNYYIRTVKQADGTQIINGWFQNAGAGIGITLPPFIDTNYGVGACCENSTDAERTAHIARVLNKATDSVQFYASSFSATTSAADNSRYSFNLVGRWR